MTFSEFKQKLSKDEILKTKYLVFSGGGVRGLAFIGAYFVLTQYMKIWDIDINDVIIGTAGSSAGALFALMVALKLTVPEMIKWWEHANMSRVVTDLNPLMLMTDYGLNDKNIITKTIQQILEEKTGNANITFKQLYDITGVNLTITVSRVEPSQPEYHNYILTPNEFVYESISTSATIPFLFTPTAKGKYHYVDGAILDNLPLYFDNDYTLGFLLKSLHESYLPSPKTFKIGSTDCVDNLSDQKTHTNDAIIKHFIEYCEKVSMMASNRVLNLKLQALPPGHRKKIVIIDTKTVKSWNFTINSHTRQNLTSWGARAMQNKIENITPYFSGAILTKLFLITTHAQ